MKHIDAEKMTKFEETLADIIVSSQGLCTYEACKDMAKREAPLLIASLQQERPEVDLDKFTEKIKTFQARYGYPKIVSIRGAMAFMARMFYQYPNIAREWYEQLPKATMD